jgi:SAM-dependent methyltransferase
MWEQHLRHLCCPECRSDLARSDDALLCAGCAAGYPIVEGVPRFVSADNYAASFGVEWSLHARTQYDHYSGLRMSEDRFFGETGWPRDMRGELILEVGCGSGRFTEHAAGTGATVVSVDYSAAVDANRAANGRRPNVLIAQADAFRLPVRDGYFDRVFCFGVLQHTPDPRAAFLALTRHAKPGGYVVADVYLRSFTKVVLGTKYWVRPLTCRLPPDTLYRWVRRYIDVVWPLAGLVRRIPKVGPQLNWRLLVGDYSEHGLTGELLKEWAYLDTFDMLAPRYDRPQAVHAVREWVEQAGLVNADVRLGYNGIEIRGRR